MSFAALSIALALAASDAPPPPEPNPVEIFFKAADVNDFAGMAAVMDRSGPGFIQKISSCYLRRVYGNNQTGEILATWMCAEGANRSRVVVASVGPAKSGKVAVSVQLEKTNDRPAPERQGSAFAD